MKRHVLIALGAGLFLIGCRSAVAPVVSVEQDCPLVIRLSSNVLDNSGLVRPAFEGLAEINGSFEVRRIDRGSAELPRTQREARWRGTSQPYSLALGMPETAWRPVGRRIDQYSYEIDPGTYQIVVRYRAVVSNARCVAGSDAFALKNRSQWVVTN
jgi:hypothetical protein